MDFVLEFCLQIEHLKNQSQVQFILNSIDIKVTTGIFFLLLFRHLLLPEEKVCMYLQQLDQIASERANGTRILQEFLELMALSIDMIFHGLFSRDFHTCQNVLNVSRKRQDFSGLEFSFRNDLTMLRRLLVTVFYRKTFLSTTLTYLLNTVRPRVYNGTKTFKNSCFNYLSYLYLQVESKLII